jgi:hypothetical protein
MPVRLRTHAAVLLGYVCVAMVFYWPLPAQLGSALLGTVSGDTGVYVWNLWVFRHEVVAHHNFPFLTLEVLPLTPPIPLTLHNYTTAANLVAFFLLPIAGVVRTFNLLTMASSVLAAYTMWLLARRSTGDGVAASVAGLAFGFSPFMNARATEHFSLVQAAPLPLFVLVFKHVIARPSVGMAAATGATVAWAFLSDPYYAVYCILIAVAVFVAKTVDVTLSREWQSGLHWHRVIDVLLVCLAGLIVGIVVRGGGQFEVMGLRVSMTRLYNPILVFTVLAALRLVLWLRPRIAFVPALPPMRVVFTVAAVCMVLVSPVLAAMGTRLTEGNNWVNPRVLWRSSAPGLDLLSFALPNPLHPWFAPFVADGLAASPGGFVENVASIPLTLMIVIAAGVVIAGTRLPHRWIGWTVVFGLLALGPFVTIAGILTYVPTPWAILRYVPVIGAARMPQRFAVLVILGVAMLFAYALRDLRARSRRPWLLTSAVCVVLLAETLPAPRTLHSAEVPAVYRIIAADPRPVRVLNLPFGLRDGLSSYGNTTAASQYYQTVHEKPIMGGYLSRLPRTDVKFYQRRRVTRVLMDLSEGMPVSAARWADAVLRAKETRSELNVGYVVVDVDRTPEPLVEFARQAFDLRLLAVDGGFALYQAVLPTHTIEK